MPLVIPDVSKQTILRYIVNHVPQENLEIRLYVNDVTPDVLDSLSTYTEMTQGNYAPIELLGGAWNFTSSAPVVATYPIVTWVFSGAVGTTIYGYYIVGKTSGKLLWSQRLSVPFPIQADGDTLKISTNIELRD